MPNRWPAPSRWSQSRARHNREAQKIITSAQQEEERADFHENGNRPKLLLDKKK